MYVLYERCDVWWLWLYDNNDVVLLENNNDKKCFCMMFCIYEDLSWEFFLKIFNILFIRINIIINV